MVWAASQKIGCGVKYCSSAKGTQKPRHNVKLVYCDYYPGYDDSIFFTNRSTGAETGMVPICVLYFFSGNIRNLRPYRVGPACDECSSSFRGFSDAHKCQNQLCSKDNFCVNVGSLLPSLLNFKWAENFFAKIQKQSPLQQSVTQRATAAAVGSNAFCTTACCAPRRIGFEWHLDLSHLVALQSWF